MVTLFFVSVLLGKGEPDQRHNSLVEHVKIYAPMVSPYSCATLAALIDGVAEDPWAPEESLAVHVDLWK